MCLCQVELTCVFVPGGVDVCVCARWSCRVCLCQVELTCVFVPGGVDGEQYLRVHPPR